MKNKRFKLKVKDIVRRKTHCFFISPHLDDAALSAGGLISYLANNKVPVTVINVFTEVHDGPATLSAKVFLKQCGFKEARKLFSERRKEDGVLFKEVGVEVINLGFTDAMWRRKNKLNFPKKLISKIVPEFGHVYPTYKFHAGIGKLSKEDDQVKSELKKRLIQALSNEKNYLVFCPVGIGNYVDHLIVRDVCASVFKNVVYWSDFNYSMEFSGCNNFIEKRDLKVAYFDKESETKKRLIEGYKTQIYAIFPHGKTPIFPDFYYLSTKQINISLPKML